MPSDTVSSYVTGADVSRFATRTRQSQQDQPQQSGDSAPPARLPPAVSLQPDGSVKIEAAQSGPTVRVMRGQDSTSVAAGRTGGVRTDTARTTQIGRD